jgi:hypothetical protein
MGSEQNKITWLHFFLPDLPGSVVRNIPLLLLRGYGGFKNEVKENMAPFYRRRLSAWQKPESHCRPAHKKPSQTGNGSRI